MRTVVVLWFCGLACGTSSERPFTSSAQLVANADRVIREDIRPAAERCYERAAGSDAKEGGRLFVRLKIGPSGAVDDATVASNTGLSDEVTRCIVAVARGAQFEPPGPSGSQMSVPFHFGKSRADAGVTMRP